MEKEKTILEMYIDSLPIFIGDEGIYPYPGIFKNKDGNVTMASFMLEPGETYVSAVGLAVKELSTEFVFGLDRYNKEGQGIDIKYKSVFTIIYFLGEKIKVGVMPYNSKKDIGEIQWDNKWWNKAVNSEFTQSMVKIISSQQQQNKN